MGKTAVLWISTHAFPDTVVRFSPSEGATTEYVQYWLSLIQGKLEKEVPSSLAQKNINLAIFRNLRSQ